MVVLASLLFPVVGAAESDSLTIAGKRAKVVGKAAMYGAGGGLVVGVASQVFKKKAKNIFVFGSLGLYAGILLGIYVVSSPQGPAPYEGPDTYEDYGDFSRSHRNSAPGVASGLLAHSRDPFHKEAVSMDFLKLNF